MLNTFAKVMSEIAATFGKFLFADQHANINSRWLLVHCNKSDRPESAENPEKRLVLELMRGISLQVLTGPSDEDYFVMLKEC